MKTNHQGSRGLTLVEVIVTVVIFGFVSAMIMAFLGPQFTDSHRPTMITRNSVLVEEKMEQVTARYIQLVNSGSPSSAIVTLEAEIVGGTYDTSSVDVSVLSDPSYTDMGSDADDLLLVRVSSLENDGGHALTNLFTTSRTPSQPLEIY